MKTFMESFTDATQHELMRVQTLIDCAEADVDAGVSDNGKPEDIWSSIAYSLVAIAKSLAIVNETAYYTAHYTEAEK